MSHDTYYRILIVDDNPAIHADFRTIILGHQSRNFALDATEAILFDDTSATPAVPVEFSIESAFQGREALEKVEYSLAEGKPFAMAFVDVRMPPGWNGIETIAHLWKADPLLQVVVCTAYSDYSLEKIIDKLGVGNNLVLLKKPFDNAEVLQLCHVLARKWTVTSQAQSHSARKVDTIGQLAHEFINLLTIIQGNAGLYLDTPAVSTEVNASLHQISDAAERAADLIRKLSDIIQSTVEP